MCVGVVSIQIQSTGVAIHEWKLMCIHPIEHGRIKSFLGFDGVLFNTSGGALHPGTEIVTRTRDSDGVSRTEFFRGTTHHGEGDAGTDT